jgi:hypothetical protein
VTHRFSHAALTTAALAAVAAIAACGGGGGGQSSLPGGAMAQAVFTIAVPSGASASAVQRRPAFISPNAQSISISVAGAVTTANLTSTSPNCTATTTSAPLTCTVTLNAPVGTDTFVVTLYQGLNASGTVLSTATVSAAVSATQPTTIPVTLGGVVASIDVTVQNGNARIPGGYATSVPVIVTAKDPSGAAIVGAGNYTNPITLTNTDTSGVTVLSTTTVTSPSTVVTLSYAPTDANSGVLAINGLPIGATTIGASATGVAASAVSPGTFQYIADRFFGFGHTRTLVGTAAVVNVDYNGLGTPLPSPSAYAYSVADTLTVHGGVTFNGAIVANSHHIFTYTQTSPAPAASPEVVTRDQYRSVTINATNAIFYRFGDQDIDVNSGAVNSPVTGNVPGTTTSLFTYPMPVGWEEDVLPHVTGTTWTNNSVPFTDVFTGAQTSTFAFMADGSWTFNETAPGSVAQTQSAAGAATNVNGNLTTTVGLPVAATPPGTGALIPVTQQTTSPTPGPVASYYPVDWYPGGDTPVQPLYSFVFSEGLTTIPGGCNVPASIATQAFVLIEVSQQLDVAAFRNHFQTWADYYVPGGVGFVCEMYTESTANYHYFTGTIANLTTIVYTIGVPNASALNVHRKP